MRHTRILSNITDGNIFNYKCIHDIFFYYKGVYYTNVNGNYCSC